MHTSGRPGASSSTAPVRGDATESRAERAERWASTMRAITLAGIAARPRRLVGGTGSTPVVDRADARTSQDATMATLRHPRPRRRRPRASTRSPIRGARASSATATASCTPSRSAGWPARPRCSCSPTTTSAPGSPTRSRWPRWPSSVAAALGLNVALTEAIALGHDCGHGPGGHASEDALSPVRAGRLRPCRVGRRRHADAAQPVRRDPRRHPQPLVVAAGAGHARGRGRVAGPTASPTCATTSRTPLRPASSPPTMLPDRGARPLRRAPRRGSSARSSPR